MERLTKKEKGIYDIKERTTQKNEFHIMPSTMIEICQKLGQLEDIEEEIGIDLITLFKLWFGKVNTIYTKMYGELNNCFEVDIYNHRIEFILDEIDTYEVTFEDYGKTWALTREELEESK